MEPAALLLIGLGVLALLLGVLGALLPILPGPPVSALGCLLVQVGLTVEGPASAVGWGICGLAVALGAVMTVLDLLAPTVVSKLGGSSKRAGRYATAGVVIALILSCTGGGPFTAATGGLGAIPALIVAVGLVFAGAFIGGVVGELEESTATDPDRSARLLRSGLAQVIGIGMSLVTKLAYCILALALAGAQAAVQLL